jgi:hypothetical protein
MLKGTLNVGGTAEQMVLVNSGVHTRKYFSENYPLFGYAVLKIFASPILGQKHFKIIVFRGRQITGLPEVPNY